MINIRVIGKHKQGNATSSSNVSGGGFANGTVTTQIGEAQGVNIWGQYHDHSGDVDGDMMVNGNITTSSNIVADGDINCSELIATEVGADSVIANRVEAVTSKADNLLVNNNATVQGTLNSSDITTQYLTVTKQAHFFSLTIDEIKSVGGQIILSAANATIDHVEQQSGQWVLYWKSNDGDKGIENNFRRNDQIICQTFNTTDLDGDVETKYYWGLVTTVGNETITLNGEETECNYIALSPIDFDGTSAPEAGDKICQLGYRGSDDNARQSAIILSAYQSPDPNVAAPSMVQYEGINTFSLDGRAVNVISHGNNTFTGEFKVVSNGSTTNIVDLIVGQQPQVMADSQQSWIMSDADSKTYALSDYQNLPTNIKVYLGSDLIPYSEWTTGSVINYNNRNYRLVGAFSPVQFSGLFIGNITHNTNDVTITWDYSGSANGTAVSNTNATITVNFTHNNTSYTAQKTVPFNVIRASVSTQGADAEYDKLMVDKLDFNVTLDNELTCDVDAKVYHIKGSTVTQLTDLTDYTANLLLSNNQTVTLNKTTSFTKSGVINSNYTGMTNPPTSATLRLFKNNVLADETTASIKFNAGSIFTLTDDAITSAVQQSNTYTDGQITTVNSSISQVQQAADSISSRVTNIENDYVTSSELTQTANNIQLNVYDELKNKTGIDVSQGQITLQGNTIVNGNLTLTQAEQGFTMIGENGITQILPKSIGTFDEFKELTTTTIRKEDKTNGTFLTSTSAIRQYKFTTDFVIGTIKAGETINVAPLPTDYFITMPQGIVNIVGQGNISEVSKQISFIEGDEIQQTTSYQSHSVSYLCQGGTVTVRTTYTVNINNQYFENGGENPYQVIKINVTVPNDVFMLIGNDGLAVNFGTSATAYIGTESTTLRYGQYGFKVDATDGIQVFNGVYWYTLDEYIGMIAGHA